MEASSAVVFPSNFCEPAEKRKGEAPAQGVKGIQPDANNNSPLKGMPKPLDYASVSTVLEKVGNRLQNSEAYAFPFADGRTIVICPFFPDPFTPSIPFCCTTVLFPRQCML